MRRRPRRQPCSVESKHSYPLSGHFDYPACRRKVIIEHPTSFKVLVYEGAIGILPAQYKVPIFALGQQLIRTAERSVNAPATAGGPAGDGLAVHIP